MSTCATCGSHLSRDYGRVCGDNDDTVRDCPHCAETERAEARRSATDATEEEGTDDGTDSSKLVIPADTDAEGSEGDDGRLAGARAGSRRGGPRVIAGSDAGRGDGGGRRSGTGNPGRARDDGTGAILSSVLDALR